MYTRDLTAEQKLELLVAMLDDVIKTQEMNIKVAEKKELSGKINEKDAAKDWLKAYELKSFCEQMKEIIDGSYDITDSKWDVLEETER